MKQSKRKTRKQTVGKKGAKVSSVTDLNPQPPTPGTKSSADENTSHKADDASIAASIKQQVADMEKELDKASLSDVEQFGTELSKLWSTLNVKEEDQTLLTSMGYDTVEAFIYLDNMSFDELLDAFPRRDLRKESFQDTILYALCLGSCFNKTIRQLFQIPSDAKIPQRDIPTTIDQTADFIKALDKEDFMKLYKQCYWKTRTQWFNYLEDNLPGLGSQSLVGTYVSASHHGSKHNSRNH